MSKPKKKQKMIKLPRAKRDKRTGLLVCLKCKTKGLVFAFGDRKYGNLAFHRCPKCGKEHISPIVK